MRTTERGRACRGAVARSAWAMGMCVALASTLAGQQGAPRAAPVLTGQVRLRGEWDDRTAGTRPDAAVLSRVRIGIATDVQPWLSGFLQIQDARAWGTELDPTEGTADQMDLHQAYLDLRRGATTLRLGRQEVGLGDERLVGSLGWGNTGRSFDGALVRRTFAGGEARALWMSVRERDARLGGGVNPQANEGADTDGWLLGAFVSRAIGRVTLEGTLLHDRKAVTDESNTARGRILGTAGRLAFEAGAAWQFGPYRTAWFYSGALGAAVGRGGRVAAQLDYLSGDDDPLDADRTAFHSLYPTGHAYHGYMDYFLSFPANTAAGGLVDAMLKLQAPLAASPRWSARADVHHFSLAEARGGERTLGIEADVVVGRTLAPGVGLELGGSLFAPGDAMGLVSPAFALRSDQSTSWGYLMLTVGW